MHRDLLRLSSVLLVSSAACGAGSSEAASAPVVSASPVGEMTRADLERALPAWTTAASEAEVHESDAHALSSVPAGADVVVYLGGWCGDSRREVSRLWHALDVAGEVPFSIRWIAVGRDKQAPRLTENADLRYVPTFVVMRQGREVGRIVESAPRGIETELNALLRGEASGVISGRTDL